MSMSMSSEAAWDAYTIIEQFFDLRLNALCSISASVLLFYDYLLTLEKEAGLFWKRKVSGASLLFLFNRYLSLLTQMFDVVQFTSHMSDEVRVVFEVASVMLTFHCVFVHQSCDKFSKVVATIELCQYVPWAVFSGLRAYALSRYKSLGILVFLLSLGPDVINLIKYAYGLSGFSGPVWAVESCAQGKADISPLPHLSCIDYARTSSCSPKFVIISRSCLITADVILILITWISLWKRGTYVSGKPTRLSFTKVLLRDGTVYFIVILTMNILHLAFALPSVSRSPSTRNFSQITVFTEPITAILVSRFLIDLQEANRKPMKVASDDPLHFSSGRSSSLGSLRFANVVSSVGATFSGPGVGDLESETEWESSHDTCEEDGGIRSEPLSQQSAAMVRRGPWTSSDESAAGPSQSDRDDPRSTPSSGATLVAAHEHDP